MSLDDFFEIEDEDAGWPPVRKAINPIPPEEGNDSAADLLTGFAGRAARSLSNLSIPAMPRDAQTWLATGIACAVALVPAVAALVVFWGFNWFAAGLLAAVIGRSVFRLTSKVTTSWSLTVAGLLLATILSCSEMWPVALVTSVVVIAVMLVDRVEVHR